MTTYWIDTSRGYDDPEDYGEGTFERPFNDYVVAGAYIQEHAEAPQGKIIKEHVK